MLQFIRDRATGWIAWAIVILICIPFALWGINEYMAPPPSVSVASVNGAELSLRQYHEALRRDQYRLERLLGPDASRLIDEQALRRQSLDRLIRDELVVQAARDVGLRISDEQLARAIHVQEEFQENGEFSQARYDVFLRREGYSPGGFEHDLRRSMLTEQVFSGLAGSAIATERAKREMIRLEGQTRSYSALTVPAAHYVPEEVSAADIESYYAEHEAQMVTREEVLLAYVQISRDEIAAGIEVEEAELRARYESTKANYVAPERRTVRHLLVRVPEDAGESAVQSARERANDLRRQLEASAPFGELAKQHSEDVGSAQRGGELGAFERGDMPDLRLEGTVFSLAVGEIGEPVRSSAGFHIVEVTDIKPAHTKSYEEAHEEVLHEFRRQQAEQIFFHRVERLANLAFEAPSSLEVVSEELDLEIREAGPVGRSGAAQGLLGDPRVIEAAFNPDVLVDRNNSDVIQLDADRAVVLRVKEHYPTRPLSLEEAREEISRALREEISRERAAAEGAALVEKLRGGSSRGEIAAQSGLDWVEHAEVSRRSSSGSDEVREHVFSMPRPAAGSAAYSGVASASGDYVVVVLTDVVDGDPQSLNAQEVKAIEDRLALDLGQSAYNAFVDALREEADVVINEENL